MDKTQKIIIRWLVFVGLLFSIIPIRAQSITEIQFCDRSYEYAPGKDSITLFFNLLDKYGNRVQDVSIEQLEEYLVINEDDILIPWNRSELSYVNSGQRIPGDYTFSVLVDLSIPPSGKEQIFNAVASLIESAPDSCVYLSFFGDYVSPSIVVTRDNYQEQKPEFFKQTQNKYFYSAVYSKLTEFSSEVNGKDSLIRVHPRYERNVAIANRAYRNRDKNILFIFTEGSKRPSDEELIFNDIVAYQGTTMNAVPKVIALYYTEEGEEPSIEFTLKGICAPRDLDGSLISQRAGQYLPSNDMSQVLEKFEEVVNDAMYDFSYKYRVEESQNYSRLVKYSGEWKGENIGTAEFSIGTAERSWPIREEEAVDIVLKYFYALLVTLVTMLFFFVISKIVIPFIRAKSFAIKYYKKYVPEQNVTRRVCTIVSRKYNQDNLWLPNVFISCMCHVGSKMGTNVQNMAKIVAGCSKPCGMG